MSDTNYNYKDKSAPKLTQEFREKFIVSIGKGKGEAIKVDGLIILAHEKGIKEMVTKIIQYPSDDNHWTCIASTRVVGYDYNPVTDAVEEVVFEDFADANASNCSSMTASAYIRMASTRSVGRTLNKYTNVRMVCADEISSSVENIEPMIDTNELTTIKSIVGMKHITPEQLSKIMIQKFGHTNYTGLTENQGKELICTLEAIPVSVQQPQQPQNTTPTE